MALILIVDDDEDLLELLSLVGVPGHRLVSAGGALAALRLARRLPIDLLVTDVMMADLDGLSLVRELRNRGLGVPVVLMSSRADVPQLGAGIGAMRTLRKPFSARHLARAVEEALEPVPVRTRAATSAGFKFSG